jgi:4-amino-4-deoxy-L-arabinose transferase-like glycosyltransferase
MFRKMVLFIKENWILLGIILISALLRFYRLPEMASYDYDQEFVSQFVLEVVKVYPIRYIGQGLSVMGLFMGPFYFYFLVPFYILFNLNPLGGYVGSVYLGLLNVFLYYVVAKKLFNSKIAGLIAAFIRGVGFYAIAADLVMTPAYTSDMTVLLVFYFLFLIWNLKEKPENNFRQKNFYLLPSLFFVFGLFTSIHPIQFPLILVGILLIFIWKKRFTILNWLVSIFAFIIPISPILYFDKLRNWSMVKQIMGMLQGTQTSSTSESFDLSRFLTTLKSINSLFRDLYTTERYKTFLSIYILLLIWFITFYLIKKYLKKQAKFHLAVISVTYLVVYLYYVFFPTHVPEYYVLSLQTLIVLYMGFVISAVGRLGKYGRIIIIALLLFFTINNGKAIWNFWHTKDPVRLINKQEAIRHIIQKADGKPFQISYVTLLGWRSGFDSLFEIEGVVPTDEGPVFTIINPKNFTNNPEEIHFSSGGVGVKYPDEY